QRLDSAGRGAGADRDQVAGGAADGLDPLRVVRRGDRALDEREVVRAFEGRAARLEEVRDLDFAGEGEQLVLAVEQRQLAAVARGELPDRELRLPCGSRSGAGKAGTPAPGRLRRAYAAHSSRTSISGSTAAQA